MAIFFKFLIIPLLINYKSDLSNDHNNKINVLLWLAVPSILLKLSSKVKVYLNKVSMVAKTVKGGHYIHHNDTRHNGTEYIVVL